MIKTTTANIEPVYARLSNGIPRHSRYAIDLFEPNETIKINPAVFESQTKGASFPNDNLFSDLMLMHPSSFYSDTFEYIKSTIKRVNKSLLDIDEFVYAQFEKIFMKSETIIIPLSGGYDSRLNIAMARHFRDKYKNRIIAFHKVGDDQSLEIVKKVCSVSEIPLVLRNDQRKWSFDSRMYNREFSLMHSGTYRHSIINYSNIMDEFRELYPDCAFLGFGAECHKGKHYCKFDQYGNDYEKIFGYQIPEIIVSNAQAIYDDPFSIMDYIHYVSFISNGYGKRCFYFCEKYGVEFPLLDDAFLSAVFSLPRKQKEGASLVMRWIAMMDNRLLEIPFESCCTKTFKKNGVFKRITNQFKKKIDKALPANQLIMQEFESKSPVTNTLKSMIQNNDKRYKLMYVYQLLLYFMYAEKEKNLEFILEN